VEIFQTNSTLTATSSSLCDLFCSIQTIYDTQEVA
jgi:hypothetical protein